jgi:orotidine-5'-phosphate decarboxylase
VIAGGAPALCVALDAGDAPTCRWLAETTSRSADLYKIGLTAFWGGGREVVDRVASLRPVFLDLKLHDIPAQVAGAVTALSSVGASFITVHAWGGADMVRAAVAAAEDGMEVIAVTVLTSLDAARLEAMGVAGPVHERVLRVAELAVGAGAAGLVCSPLEVRVLRDRFGTRAEGGPLLVVTGIRPAGAPAHDQSRTDTAAAAAAAGADVVVVGRPITAAADPAAAAAATAADIAARAG